jgi:hypothetical protein
MGYMIAGATIMLVGIIVGYALGYPRKPFNTDEER